jgi:hypothetical protein
MKTLTRSLIVLLFCLTFSNLAKSQPSSIILYSENGELFSAYLNGILQNTVPSPIVRLTNLFPRTYTLKVEFTSRENPPATKKIQVTKGTETIYTLKHEDHHGFVIRFKYQAENNHPYPDPDGHPGNDIDPGDQGHAVLPGYNGPVGCPWPIGDEDFRDVKKTISEKSFDDTKLEIAKQVTSSNCLFAEQVKAIMGLFSFENTKLEYAKFAYRFTFDTGNYYKINDAFSFDSSVSDLNKFLQGERHR